MIQINQYVVEYYYHRVKYDASGKYVKTMGSYGAGNYGFRYPSKCTIDINDNLFVYIWYDSKSHHLTVLEHLDVKQEFLEEEIHRII